MLAVVVVDLAHPAHVVPVQLLKLAVFLYAGFCRGRPVPPHELAEVPDVCLAELFPRSLIFLDIIRELRFDVREVLFPYRVPLVEDKGRRGVCHQANTTNSDP